MRFIINTKGEFYHVDEEGYDIVSKEWSRGTTRIDILEYWLDRAKREYPKETWEIHKIKV